MHQSIHQQLIRGIQGLNPAQARQLQDLLAAVKDGSACASTGFDDAPPHPAETGTEADALVTLAIREEDPVPVDGPAQEVADDEADRPSREAGMQALAPTEAPDAGPASDDTGIATETVAAVEADGDLPQPVCAQEEHPGAVAGIWGPPPLSRIKLDQMHLIASLIREANEARNARRQRFGL